MTARLTAINAELRSPADGWRETLVEIEHARKTFDVYQRVHSELEDGKLFANIDCGLRSPPEWGYASWLAYMQQRLINHLRGILLDYARIAKLGAERDAAIQRDNVNAALTRAAIKKSDARIAELEAEQDSLREELADTRELLRHDRVRITELEAERDALAETLRERGTLSIGEALAYRSEDLGPGKKPIR